MLHVMHMVVVVVMMMMMVMVMVMVMMHLCHRSGRSRLRGGRGRFLRDGVAGEPDGERGGNDKALDHRQKSSRRRPQRPTPAKLTQFA